MPLAEPSWRKASCPKKPNFRNVSTALMASRRDWRHVRRVSGFVVGEGPIARTAAHMCIWVEQLRLLTKGLATVPTHTSFALDHAAGAKPVARISPTSRAFVLTTTIVTLLAFASAFTISGFSQVWAGGELGLPVWARFAVPLAVDMPLIAFALSSIARRAQGEPVWPSAAWLGLFSASSIAINVWHGISEAGAHGIALAGLVGLSALVPLAVIATSGEVLSILTAPPRGSAEQRRSIARVADRGLLAERSALATGRLVKLPKRGTPEREDLAAVVRDHVKAFPAASVAERARSTGVSKEFVFEVTAAQ